MLSVKFMVPTAAPDTVRHTVQRVAGLVSGQVTSVMLDGPPLTATVEAVIPEERLAKVKEVAKILGVTCELD